MNETLVLLLRIGAGLLGAAFIFVFFKSIIRVGLLNQHYQDPVAFWTGRCIFSLFRLRVLYTPKGQARRAEIMTWFWPCMLIGIITTWFLLVTAGFALLNLAFAAEKTLTAAIVASGSALSTLGFSTPATTTGQFLAIFEGAIGLFLIVYLFTFLPSFMDLIRERGSRVAWIYHRTGNHPSGVGLLTWLARNGRMNNLPAFWEDWAIYFHTLANSRSVLPVLCIMRPLRPDNSWICAFAAFLDALALFNSVVENALEDGKICFDNGVSVMRNTHASMHGTPVAPTRDPGFTRVTRAQYDAACTLLAEAGFKLAADREAAWQRFAAARLTYEREVDWLAAAISDPVPDWPSDAKSLAQ